GQGSEDGAEDGEARLRLQAEARAALPRGGPQVEGDGALQGARDGAYRARLEDAEQDGRGDAGHRDRRQQPQDGGTHAPHHPEPQGAQLGAEHDAEDEDEARRGQAPQGDGLGEAPPRGRLEAAQAREEESEAPSPSARKQADREVGRRPPPGARAVSLSWEERTHATGQGRTEDTPPAQEDPQAGQGLRRRPAQALPHGGRDRAARGRLRLPRTQAEEAADARRLDRPD